MTWGGGQAQGCGHSSQHSGGWHEQGEALLGEAETGTKALGSSDVTPEV